MNMFNCLLDNKVNLQETNKLGDTCLKIAQKSGNQQIVLLLVGKGNFYWITY